MDEDKLTGEQICTAAVKYLGLSMTGKEFWDADPSGHLFHVFQVRAMMEAEGINIRELSATKSLESESNSDVKESK